MFNAGLFRAPVFPHDSLSSPPSANPTREAGLHTPLSNVCVVLDHFGYWDFSG